MLLIRGAGFGPPKGPMRGDLALSRLKAYAAAAPPGNFIVTDMDRTVRVNKLLPAVSVGCKARSNHARGVTERAASIVTDRRFVDAGGRAVAEVERRLGSSLHLD